MLKQADGSYACVAESTTRFTLEEVIVPCAVLVKLFSFRSLTSYMG